MRAVSGWVSNFSWTYEAEIAQLSPEATRQTYLTIDSSRGDMNSDSLKTLDELLKELDYVPLAIRLLTTVGRGLSPSYLLGQWREECTELLELRKDRQSSIAVSISISLSQLKITNNPEALHLLGILSPARDRVMYYILYLLHGRVVLLAVTTVGHDTLLYRVLPPLSVYINIF